MSLQALKPGVSNSVAYFRFVWRKTRPSWNKHKPPTTITKGEFGTVKILLNDKVVPKTCENFKALCTHKKGYGYIESKFHHIVSGFGLYGGDIVERVEKKQLFDDDFTGLTWSADVRPHGAPTHLPMPNPSIGLCGRAASGPTVADYVFEEEFRFEDENFKIKHDRPGIITMANTGPDSNNSNFVILTEPAPWLDGKNVAFGEVIEGIDLLREIELLHGSDSGHVYHGDIVISQAGLLESPDQDVPEQPDYTQTERPTGFNSERVRLYPEPYKKSW